VRASARWIGEFVDIDLPIEKLAELLSFSGTKVEAITQPGKEVGGVVVAEVLAIEEHPNADNLVLVDVKTSDGNDTRVVCGARNFAVGDRVPYATVGSRLSGMEITERKIRGQVSNGMLCSAMELGISKDHSGILVLSPDAPLGEEIVSVLGLDDSILDLEITPNRPDCMGMIGLAREVAALLGKDLKVPDVDLKTDPDLKSPVKIDVKDPLGCPRFVARYIEGVNIGPSPARIANRLLALGVRPISNVVDVTNYMMLETGQPLHAYDAAKVRDNHIIVRRAHKGEKLMTLDGVERTMHADDLLIADPKKTLGIAGVMGGEDSEVTDETTNIILECASFDHATIAFSGRRHLLRTEASARFERKSDPEMPPYAAARAAQLIAELSGGRVSGDEVDVRHAAVERPTLTLRPPRTDKILGVSIAPADQARYLRSIQLGVTEAEGNLAVEVPSWRPDLLREIDLVEEVGRLAGLHRLPSTLPPGTKGGLERTEIVDRAIRRFLVDSGLDEAWTAAFMSDKELDRLMLPADHPARRLVRIANAAGEETSAVRSTIVPGLLRSIAHNTARRATGTALFEIARLFEPTDELLPREAVVIAGAFAGEKAPKSWFAATDPWDFFGAKGVLDALFDSLRVPPPRLAPATGMPFHPTRAARVLIGDTDAGVIGELHPRVCDEFQVPEGTVVFEIGMAPLLAHLPDRPSAPDLPRFPAVYLDIALVVDEEIEADKVRSLILDEGRPEVTAARLFDIYRGEPIQPGKKSLAFALEVLNPDKTLTEEQALTVRDRVVDRLRSELDAELRA
jgi:phenylalanyl-tRNA synthetase beta chain